MRGGGVGMGRCSGYSVVFSVYTQVVYTNVKSHTHSVDVLDVIHGPRPVFSPVILQG